MNLEEALAPDAEPCTELSIDFSEGEVLDERVAKLTELEALRLDGPPAGFVLPAAVATLPKLREVRLLDSTWLPTLEALQLEALSLRGVPLEEVRVPRSVRRLTLRTKDPARDLPLLAARAPWLASLTLRGDDCAPAALPEALSSFEALEALELHGLEQTAMPATLGRLKALRTLLLDANELASQVRAIATSLPSLQKLTLHSSTEEPIALPEELASLQALEVLEVMHVPIASLPGSFASLRRLEELQLAELPDGALPEVVCELPALRRLELTGHLTGLPASMAKLTSLRELVLDNVLNKGSMISGGDDTSRLKALPRVLSELTGLEVLRLDSCGVFDVAPLRPLQRLRRLSLKWSALRTLEDVGALSALEVFDVEYASAARDLTPLSRLSELRELGLLNMRPDSLAPLKALPKLRKLDLSGCRCKDLAALFELDVELEADDELVEQYRKRSALRALPSPEQLRAGIASESLEVAQTALGQLATFTAATSTKDGSAIRVALGLDAPKAAAKARDEEEDEESEFEDDDEEGNDDADADEDEDEDADADADADADEEEEPAPAPRRRPSRDEKRALPPLDACLDRHLPRLSPAVLSELFAALFQNVTDDFAAATRIARELATRGDDASQLRLVQAFEAASEYYDTGHRMMESTVHDVLLDELFPELRAAALTRLLAWCTDGHLVGGGNGDEMAALFLPALRQADPTQRAALFGRLEKYLRYCAKYSTEELDSCLALLDELEAPEVVAGLAEVRGRLAGTLAALAARKRIEEALESDEPARVTAAMAELHALGLAACKEHRSSLWQAAACEGLGADGLRLALQIFQLLQRDDGMSGVLARLAKQELALAKREAAQLGLQPAALSALVRTAVVKEHAEDEPDEELIARLRGWANELDGIDASEGLRREVTARLQEGVGSFSLDDLRPPLEAIFALPDYRPPDGALDAKTARSLAGDIGQLVNDRDDWPFFCELAKHLHKLGLTGSPLERILAQLVGVSTLSKDDEARAAAIALVPEPVTLDTLAYNLACSYGAAGARAETLRWTKHALSLGKSPDQFLDDSDFAAFQGDEEFLAMVDAAR